MLRTTAPGSVGGLHVDRNVELGVNGTVGIAADRNNLQEEIVNAILASGLSLSSSQSQLAQAIKLLRAQSPGESIRGLTASQETQSSSLTVAKGSCLDVTRQYLLSMPGSSFTKNANAVFASGAGNGGLMYGSPSLATVNRLRAANVATLTVASGHGYAVGDLIFVVGLGAAAYNTTASVPTFARVSAVTSTTISYPNAGSDEGATADTGGRVMPAFLHVFALGNSTAEAVFDVGFSLHRTPTSLPSGFDLFRRILSIPCVPNGTDLEIPVFAQNGDSIILGAYKQTYDATNPGTSEQTIFAHAPPQTIAKGMLLSSNASTTIQFFRLGTNAAASASQANADFGLRGDGSSRFYGTWPVNILTDASSRFRLIQSASTAGDETEFVTHGWIDDRRIDLDI